MRRFAAALALALLGAAPATGQADEAAAARVRAHVEFLASDLLGGRGTGTTGERYAAAYIESQLRLLGLDGAFQGEFVQPVPLHDPPPHW